MSLLRNEKQTMPQFCSSSLQGRKFLHLHDVVDDLKIFADSKEKATNHRSRHPGLSTVDGLRVRL